MFQLMLIGLFGAAGAIFRYLASIACLRLLGARFAFGTLAVNLAGCFALGLLMELWSASPTRLPAFFHPAISVGFLGALTTFSTFGYETVRHAEQGQWWLAGLNVVANLLLGLLAAASGLAAGRWLC